MSNVGVKEKICAAKNTLLNSKLTSVPSVGPWILICLSFEKVLFHIYAYM